MKYLREITCERIGLNEHTPHQVTAFSDSGKLQDNEYYRCRYIVNTHSATTHMYTHTHTHT